MTEATVLWKCKKEFPVVFDRKFSPRKFSMGSSRYYSENTIKTYVTNYFLTSISKGLQEFAYLSLNFSHPILDFHSPFKI